MYRGRFCVGCGRVRPNKEFATARRELCNTCRPTPPPVRKPGMSEHDLAKQYSRDAARDAKASGRRTATSLKTTRYPKPPGLVE